MIREKTGKLINDRTQTFGLNFIDLIILSVTWLLSSLIVFKDRALLSVIFTGVIYIILVIIRTTKRPGWISEVFKYYCIREFFKGVYSERNIRKSK